MALLVFIDAPAGAADDDALGVLSKAAELGGPVTALLCGHGAAGQAGFVAAHGAARVLVADHETFAAPLAAPRVALLAGVCADLADCTVLFATSALTCDVAAALAARLEAGISWGLTDIVRRDGRLVGRRPVEHDTLVAEIGWRTSARIGLFRPRAFEPRRATGATAADIRRLGVEDTATGAVRLVDITLLDRRDQAALGEADIVVAGGRGLGRAENLRLVRDLAAALGGVPGVSLPLVEMGWAPRSMQVGQTGTVVTPRLYVACGISGQIQHRIGMERSGTIVAINTDPAAPIMRFCDLAVVGEVEKILPPLTALVRARRSGRPGQEAE